MKFRYILFIYILVRIIDAIVILAAPSFIKLKPTFTYDHSLSSNLSSILNVLGNFDGVHYAHIAREGYAQYEQAFFPMYPVLINIASRIVQSELIAGILISNIIFLLALYIFYRLFSPLSLIFLLLFPTSFFFTAVYTESVFLFFILASIFFLKQERFLNAGVISYFAALTRLSGVFLLIPFFLKLLTPLHTKQNGDKNIIIEIGNLFKDIMKGFTNLFVSKYKNFYIVIFPVFGLATYCLYLWSTTGDPLYFFNSQPAFGANRSTNLVLLPQVYYRYLKIFFTADKTYDYFIALVEFSIFSLIFTFLVYDFVKTLYFKNIKEKFFRLGLNLFSFANLILPTLTGTFSSIPRYALLSISFFLVISEIHKKWIKIGLGITFILLHIVLLAFFSRGYFVG